MSYSITKFARHYRLTAAAVLVQIATDESAPAASRVAASTAILGYSDGKPSITRHVTARDVVAMPKEVRNSLWRALFDVEEDFPDFVVERINATVQREAQRLTAAKPNRFTRGSPAGERASLPAHVSPAP